MHFNFSRLAFWKNLFKSSRAPRLDSHNTKESTTSSITQYTPGATTPSHNAMSELKHGAQPDSPHLESEPYYNPRLDPKNFMEGPLSSNPATRLRQMLARPGIVVRRLLLALEAVRIH
jgi:hypothetical protein